ncbi:hypothetical protein C8Q80DRAFT_913089 [Daedaleopsis nitida]|nr:hypothetical protein C8Q80DRAFT_913089 [Daedaleopsis nitida]
MREQRESAVGSLTPATREGASRYPSLTCGGRPSIPTSERASGAESGGCAPDSHRWHRAYIHRFSRREARHGDERGCLTPLPRKLEAWKPAPGHAGLPESRVGHWHGGGPPARMRAVLSAECSTCVMRTSKCKYIGLSEASNITVQRRAPLGRRETDAAPSAVLDMLATNFGEGLES